VNQKFKSDDNILAHTGVRIPHPEPYSGEANLKRFEIFIAGIL